MPLITIKCSGDGDPQMLHSRNDVPLYPSSSYRLESGLFNDGIRRTQSSLQIHMQLHCMLMTLLMRTTRR